MAQIHSALVVIDGL